MHGTVSVKGKDKSLQLYRVIWLDEEIVLNVEPIMRSGKPEEKQKRWIAQKVLELEVTRENNQLKISGFERQTGEVSTVRHYEEVPISFDSITSRCNKIVETLNSCNREGNISKNILTKLRNLVFWLIFFPTPLYDLFRNPLLTFHKS